MTVPRATYRVQLNRAFPLHQARRLVPFLQRLGITDLYISPPFQARSGSEHGYDVTDPLRVSADIGGDECFAELAGDLRERGMGLLVDIVPNHMAASSENRWWTDVLQCGHDSEFADYFDVEWSSTVSGGREKILLPILARPFGQTLEDRNIRLGIDESGFVVHYFSIKLPVHPSSYRFIAGEGVAAAKSNLWERYNSDSAFRTDLDERMNLINGRDGEPASVDLLEELLGRQTYRLAFWKNARERINYRRFFDVSDLVGLRQDRPDVFTATHRKICEWVRSGLVRGLRVDHVDGLLNPREYLERLSGDCGPRPYIVVEKILIEDERLPNEWPVDGTTGYDFLGVVNNVFVDGQSLAELQQIYSKVAGLRWTLADAAYEQKRWIALHLFRGEMNALGLHLELIADIDRHARDLSVQEMRAGLLEVTACLPVYRTYIESAPVSHRDRVPIEQAVQEAQRRKPEIGVDVYEFIKRVLLLDFPRNLPVEQEPDWVRFVMRWQQLTGPISAKGVEDTAMYLYNRLISMNEVGGRAGAVTVEGFHQFCLDRAAQWPATMNATSTHDTKRSEDVRARLNVLTELPAEWGRALMRWSRWNRDRKVLPNAPDANEEILLYQTMLGAWPLHAEDEEEFVQRLKAYVVKAAREAKVYSSWIKPDEQHESAIHRFIDAILDPATSGRFIQHFRTVQSKLAWYGALNSLSQTLLKSTAPGAPDFYQGAELWSFSLVDPDNRRPVEVASRLALCGEMDRWNADELLKTWRDGRIKCFVIAQALRERLDGEYIPIHCDDERVIAFARRRAGRWVMTVVPRFVAKLAGVERWPVGRRVWRNTELALPDGAPSEWRNVFTGESVLGGKLAGLLHRFPVGLFVAVE